MENTSETEKNQAKLQSKSRFWGFFGACLRWFVIGALAIALGQFLYLVFAVDFSFDYVWYPFGVVLLIECFLIFSTARFRQYLARKFLQFLKGAGKVSVFLIRWVFILLFAVILLGGLYFKAPWKILVLDGLLLALLTIVPKKKRKYGWLTLAAAVLGITIWIFIPEKDTGDWRPYTFDEEVAALNNKYGVPTEKNAAPYYKEKVNTSLLNWDDLMEPTLEHGKVLALNAIGNNCEINNKGKIRLARNFTDPSEQENSFPVLKFNKQDGYVYEEKKIPSIFWQERQWKFDRFLGWMKYSIQMEEVPGIIDEVFVEFYQKVKDIEHYEEPESLKILLDYDLTYKSVLRLLCIEVELPTVKMIKDNHERIRTKQNGILSLVALKEFYNQHNRWPDSLEELSGSVKIERLDNFIFQRINDCFILYHIGPNGKDEKGFNESTRYTLNQKTSTWEKVETADDILIWPKNEDDLKRMLGIEEPEPTEIPEDVSIENISFF